MAEKVDKVLHYIHTVTAPPEGGEVADADLLEHFLAGKDESAFEELVQRHGPMVLAVCRRILKGKQDAEDAFQATFLVLVRRAAAIGKRESLASFLHGVALRTSLKARGDLARRRWHERQAVAMASSRGDPSGSEPESQAVWAELCPVLDEEVQALTEPYRTPFVLCYLEGRTYAEAARQLGWSRGTLSTRLARARELLRARLAGRGVNLSAGLLGAALTEQGAPAAVSMILAGDTVQAAVLVAAGKAAASARAMALAEGVIEAMSLTKLNHAATLGLLAVCLLLGAGLLGFQAVSRARPAVEADTQAPQAKKEDAPKVDEVKPAPGEEVRPAEPSTYQNNPRVLQGTGGGQVWAVAISPNGKTLAAVAGGTGNNEGALTLYDLPSGKERVTLVEPKPIRCVAFSRDGKHLATGDFSNIAQLRDPKTGAVRHVLSGHKGTVNSLAFTPDSKTLLTASFDRTVMVWNVADGKSTQTIEAHTDAVLAVAVSRDGKTLVTGSRDKTAKVWDLPGGKLRHTLEGHDNWIEGVAVSLDDKIIATGSLDRVIRLWDAATGKHLRTLSGHTGGAHNPVFLPGGKKLVCCSNDRTVRLWDIDSADLEATIETGHQERLYALAVTTDGKTLVTGSWDGTVKLWDLDRRAEKQSLRALRYRPENSYPLLSLACSPDGKLLAASGEEKIIKLLEADTGRVVRVLEGHEDIAGRVAFSTDGKTLASAGFDGKVILWDVEKGTKKQVLDGHANWVFGVAFSPDGKLLASCGYDKTIRLWDAKTGKPIATLNRHRGGVRAIAFSPDSKQIASGGTDLTIRVWDIEKKESIQTIKGHEDAIRSVAFSVDGKRLLSGGEDSTARLWNIADGKQIGVYQVNAIVREAIFSPRGRALAVAAEDRSIRILDPELRILRSNQSPHTAAATCLVYSPDARSLFSGSSDRTIRRWEAAVDARSALVTLRTGAKLMAVASYSPDGKWLATAGFDRLLRVRPAEQGALRWAPEGLDSSVMGMALSPDGKTLASGHMDQTVKLWDRETGKRKAVLSGHKHRVWAMAFSPDGKKLVSVSGSWHRAGEGGDVKLWDLTTNKEEATLPDHAATVMAVAWSSDGKTIATGARDGLVRLFDAKSLKELHVLRGHKENARSVVFSPDGRFLCTGSADALVKVWSVADGKEIVSLKGPEKGVNCVDWSRDGKHLAAVARPAAKPEPGEVRLWSVSMEAGPPAFKEKAVLKGHTAHVLACAFSPDSKTLASVGGVFAAFGEVIVWDVATGKERLLLHGHREWTAGLAFSSDSQTLYTGGGSREGRGEVRAWRIGEGGWSVPEAHKGDIRCAAWSSDGKLLATACTTGVIKLWDSATGKLMATLTGHKKAVRALAFSPDAETLASAGVDKSVRLWNLANHTQKAELTSHARPINGLVFSRDGQWLATCSAEFSDNDRGGEIKVFDARTGKERTGAAWNDQPARSVAFSPDGKYLATGGFGANSLKIYDLKTGRLHRTIMGAHSVRAVAYSPDGKRLASSHGIGSARGNGSIQVWDTTTWQEVMALTGHTALCPQISFSTDGQRLASASNDGTVKVWDVATPAPGPVRMAGRPGQ
jgi:RNA polymerase sigma factor (sigma-70 family)